MLLLGLGIVGGAGAEGDVHGSKEMFWDTFWGDVKGETLDGFLARVKDQYQLSMSAKGRPKTDGTQDLSVFGYQVEDIETTGDAWYTNYIEWGSHPENKEAVFNDSLKRYGTIISRLSELYGAPQYIYYEMYTGAVGAIERNIIFDKKNGGEVLDAISQVRYDHFFEALKDYSFCHISMVAQYSRKEATTIISLVGPRTITDSKSTISSIVQIISNENDGTKERPDEIEYQTPGPEPTPLPDALNIGG